MATEDKNNLISYGFNTVFFLIVSCISIILQGYYYGLIDHSLQIPLVNKIIDDSLYKNDLAISYLQENFIVWIWYFIAAVSRLVDLELLLFILHFFTRFLFYISIYLLAKIITKKKVVSYLSVLFFILPFPVLGGRMMHPQFVHSSLAVPLLIFSLILLIKTNYSFSFFLLGLCFFIHPQYAGYFFIMYSIYLIVNYKKITFQTFFRFFLFVFLLPLPVFVSALKVNSKILFNELWFKIARIRLYEHLFPSTWSVGNWGKFLGFFLLASLSFFWSKVEERIKSVFLFLYVIICGYLALGFVFSELIPTGRFLMTFPFRISEFFVYLYVPFVINFFFSNLRKNKFLFLILVYLLVQSDIQRVFLFLSKANWIKLEVLTLSFIVLSLAIIGILVKTRVRVILFSFSFVLLILVIFGFLFVVFKMETLEYISWKNVQLWTERNTSIDSVFIVPPYLDGFRVWSKRNIVGDYKDGTIGLFSSEFAEKWWLIMRDYGLMRSIYSDSNQKEIFSKFEEKKFKELAGKYKADYLVIEKEKKLDLPCIYENNYFKVYLLRPNN